ncbi:MAG TPA: SRPBCC family protein [Solirubrobacteraceae bacterium]|nr:SRPBCC family protein [Solirubrobacteraceae bacterium]
MITSSVDINRPQTEVFDYLDQLDRHAEWQEALTSVRLAGEGPVGVGTRAIETRKVPGGEREMSYELTAHNPPTTSSWKGLDGPVRPNGTVTVEALDEARSRVTVTLDMEGHGFGKLLLPFVKAQARKQIPVDQAKLKEILESRGWSR